VKRSSVGSSLLQADAGAGAGKIGEIRVASIGEMKDGVIANGRSFNE
jgi:hypothetical protein